MPDIGRDIATAIECHIKALRLLNRKDTTVASVAASLNLPNAIVERAFSEFKLSGSIDPRVQRGRVVGKMEFTAVINLKKRRIGPRR